MRGEDARAVARRLTKQLRLALRGNESRRRPDLAKSLFIRAWGRSDGIRGVSAHTRRVGEVECVAARFPPPPTRRFYLGAGREAALDR
jgi:hypothetical protein